MLERTKTLWLYLICIAFIALNIYYTIRDIYITLLIPLALVLLYLYVYSLDTILFIIVLVTPLAVNLSDLEFGISVSIPSEPLMVGVLAMFMINLVYSKPYDARILKHPITILICFDLIWIFITSMTSQIPLVSFKFFAARLWFVIPFYFLGVILFKKIRNISWFVWLYMVSFLVVIVYTTYNHSLHGFEEKAGHWVMEPFYNDHTAYGAIVAMFIPVVFGFMINSSVSRILRWLAFISLMFLITALILSFCRAAWVSLAFSILVLLIVIMRIKLKWIVMTLLILTGLFFLFQNEIWDRLEKNKQGNSANFIQHLQSISNISTDNSNLERINRWQSAFRMFNERPVFGFGPGTYQFEYGPYQHSTEKTLISTNFGDRGNAHSEYIGPLAEEGLPGMLIMAGILVFTIITGLRVYKKAKSRELKILSLSILLGLITYFFHGTMNNFLDSDKASVPFWGFIAMLVAMDLYNVNGDTSIVTRDA